MVAQPLHGREFTAWMLFTAASFLAAVFITGLGTVETRLTKAQTEIYELKVKHEHWYWLVPGKLALPRPTEEQTNASKGNTQVP